ncbi:hypothetical protein RhiirC2_767528 [Rhizophagus irregularis]|uniref:RNase H type-1 domain-containing protein n=1 Tax=Rhizophagus irregularis TaxID=588596 RepID=A0A2N1P490_9GLOM|nr:hypothetical protein RhiirC2_767528 [Rhizophagus irregularis]
MFYRINQLTHLHYQTFSIQKLNSQHKNNDIIHTYDISVVGYLNDTTWFGSSQQQIEEKLSIANSFYNLNNIKVNIDKYKILTNNRLIKQPTITLTINNQQYDMPITSRNKAIQKIYNTVSEIWYPRIPYNINAYTDLVAKPSYLIKTLGLLSNYGFSFNFTFDINILDQVTSSDGNYLLSWPDVNENNNDNYKGNIPAWYNNLANNYVLSNNLRLIHPLNDVVSDINRTHKSPQIVPAISEPKFQWTIHWNNTQKQVIFGKTLSQDTDQHKSLLEYYNRQPFVVATKPFHTLRHIAYENFIKIDKSPLKSSIPQLKNCADLLHSEEILTFYTDGSVQNIGTTHSLSGYGWIQTQPSTPKISFKGSTVFFPSSSKSETMGILTTLIVSPYNCRINIYTDSANCITTFNTRMHLGIKNLLVTLHKVPGHSNNPYNDAADTLAKAGAHIIESIIINHKFFAQQSLGFASWNHLHVIDRNVRKWADNVIQPLIFNSMINNKALTPIKKQILDGDIDWTFTKEWLNHNNSDAPCSITLSKQQGNKIKKCNFIYLTIDIQQRNYPRLYPLSSIPCIQCSNACDVNAHIGLCNEHLNDIVTILIEAAYDLYDIIIENSTGIPFALSETIESSPLFNITFPGVLPQTHPGYLLIHHLVLSDLTTIFYNYIKDKKLRFFIFTKFFTILMQKVDTYIWAK